MKTILLWDPRFPDRRPARLTVEDTVASAAVRAGVAAAANPAEAGALSAGGALDPGMLTEVALQHGLGSAIRRVFLPYSVALVGAAAGVLAAVGTPLAGGATPPPTPTLTLTSPLTYATNTAENTVVGYAGNVPAGVTPTLTPNDGRLKFGALSNGLYPILVGPSASTAGTFTLAVAAAGANATSAAVTVVAGGAATDPAAIDWSTASLIGYQTNTIADSSPPAVMRKTFTPAKPIAKATLQATALGTYIPYINGVRVGDHEMAPGWTDYAKRRQFQTYNVTPMLTSGVNAVGVEVGDGWAHGYISLRGRNYYGADIPRAMVALRLDYTDGTSETIVSNATWKATTSDCTVSDWYNGCTLDARIKKDWSNPTVSDAAWPSADAQAAGSVPLVKQPSPPARRKQSIAPVARTSPSAGVYIFDFGENHAGYCRLSVSGAASGQTIVLRHGEDVKQDGSGALYTANLRAAQATDRFICAGTGTETFEPRHTYHGYRYVEVTGYPGVPPLDCLTSYYIYQDAPLVSTFTTSSPVLKASWDASTRAWKSNALTLPTDCPQRDERMGWGADAHLYAQAATFVQDCGPFLDKYCDDLDDSTVSGKVGTVAPFVSDASRGSAGWGEAAIIIPWTLYKAYGDTAYLSRHFATMKAVLPALPYDNAYNDYLNLSQPTTAEVFQYAFAYYAASIIKQIADILGDTTASSDAASKMASFSATWNSYVSNGGATIGNNSQCAYILGLAFNILPTGQRAAALGALVSSINTNGVKCGFVGLTYLHDVLADGGQLALAYSVAEKTANPALGYQLATGLTTVGEQWNPRALRGSNDAANSYNHFVRGAVLSWIARSVAGIDAATPGFATVLLRPRPGGAASSAKLVYASKAGTISTDWSVAGNNMSWSFTTPVSAIVSLPLTYTTTGLTGAISDDPITGGKRYQVPAGTYTIAATSSTPVVITPPAYALSFYDNFSTETAGQLGGQNGWLDGSGANAKPQVTNYATLDMRSSVGASLVYRTGSITNPRITLNLTLATNGGVGVGFGYAPGVAFYKVEFAATANPIAIVYVPASGAEISLYQPSASIAASKNFNAQITVKDATISIVVEGVTYSYTETDTGRLAVLRQAGGVVLRNGQGGTAVRMIENFRVEVPA